jgi:hypothetical protein
MFVGAAIFLLGAISGIVFMILVAAARRRDDEDA